MSARWRLRLLFDAGSGVLAWSGNPETEARFDYPIETEELGLPPDLAEEMLRLIADYDAAFDWDDPGRVLEGAKKAEALRTEAALVERLRALAPKLRDALGPDFEIVVER